MIQDLATQIQIIKDLKKNKNFDNHTLSQLQELPTFNGICELSFKKIKFYMLNLSSDDAVVLKYLWKNSYEELSLSYWYEMTRQEGVFIDIGAHTGIYSIIGNLNKKQNNIISIEPYFINFARLLSNLKINNINTHNCILAAASNEKGFNKFNIKQEPYYHSAGGKLSKEGKFNVSKITIDELKINKAVKGIKIDTEGHELEVLKGAERIINQNKPDLIIEINKNCFDECLTFLKTQEYKLYFFNEKEKKIVNIQKFDNDYLTIEGANCLATLKKITD